MRTTKGSKESQVLNKSNIESVLDADRARTAYCISARIMGRIYQAEGATLDECLQNLKPLIKKGTCLMRVTHNGKTITKLLNRSMTYKLFNLTSRVSKEVAFKNLKTLFVF